MAPEEARRAPETHQRVSQEIGDALAAMGLAPEEMALELRAQRMAYADLAIIATPEVVDESQQEAVGGRPSNVEQIQWVAYEEAMTAVINTNPHVAEPIIPTIVLPAVEMTPEPFWELNEQTPASSLSYAEQGEIRLRAREAAGVVILGIARVEVPDAVSVEVVDLVAAADTLEDDEPRTPAAVAETLSAEAPPETTTPEERRRVLRHEMAEGFVLELPESADPNYPIRVKVENIGFPGYTGSAINSRNRCSGVSCDFREDQGNARLLAGVIPRRAQNNTCGQRGHGPNDCSPSMHGGPRD